MTGALQLSAQQIDTLYPCYLLTDAGLVLRAAGRSISRLLPRPQYIKFNRAALLRTDLVARYTAYRTALGPTEPFTTVNEVRALEDERPVPWGDEKPVTGAQPAPQA